MSQSNNPSQPAHPQNVGSATADTSGSHTQVQTRKTSHDQSPHAAVSAESVATPDVEQSNAFFQKAHGFNISGNPNFLNIGSVTNVNRGGSDGLERLERFVSFDAKFDSSAQDPDRRCHPGTRKDVLKRLRDWVDNPNAKERIFWLSGPAGAGKSAIAQTIAHSYTTPKVAATFFFFRGDVNRNDGNRLFTTLAYQLAFSIPEIKDHIAHSLLERPDLPRTDVETQFNQLLAYPFQVLNEDATQQLAPAVEIFKKYQELAPVIIIDGVDECADEKLQRRFLKVIGDAVMDDRFPLRFLIVSRPEFHIEQTIRRFRTPILTIDLAKFNGNRDIEKYLLDEFSRIRSEQGLDPSWPGREIVQEIVYKSSGIFILASLVIEFVGDEDCSAVTQLEIILNTKPPKTLSPFAVLDQLFFQILRRVLNQDFLKRYLALLTTRISISEHYDDLYQDDEVLMHVSKQALHANLRRMRSLLTFESRIDIYHPPFLDFLHDSARSGDYYVGNQGGIKQYLEAIVDSLVRYGFTVIEQPDHHNPPHFTPRFGELINRNPQVINLGVRDWEETLRPLLDLMHKLLGSSINDSLRPGYCRQCRFFHIIYDTLTHFESLRDKEDPNVEKYLKFLEEIISFDDRSRLTSDGVSAENIPDVSYLEIMNRVPDQDFVKIFLGLLVGRCSITSGDSLSKDDAILMDISRDELGERLHEMRPILRFEPFIDVHHRSFLDFLQDQSRSGQYHVTGSAGTRRYLELMTKLLSRRAARLTNHGIDHFAPEFGKLIKHNLQAIKLDVEDWEQTLRPLLNALDKLLVPSNIDSLMDQFCQQCRFFHITYDILTHFKSLRNREDMVVNKYLKSLEEIILYGHPGHQNFETNFRPVVFGSAAIAGILMAILAHQR